MDAIKIRAKRQPPDAELSKRKKSKRRSTVLSDAAAAVTYHPMRRIPTMFWCRLMDDMMNLLQETIADNLLLLKWKHKIYGEVAKAR